jgi:hypothetical protein
METKIVNKFWIVIDSKFPTTVSFHHGDFESAKNEAIRLARKVGHEFIVMESMMGFDVNDIVCIEYHPYDDIPF